MNLFPFLPGYEDAVYETGREPAFVMLVAFLLTFILTRGYTRIARVRGWGSARVGGVHLHHVIVGLLLALGAGALTFAFDPAEGFWQLFLAACFGSGAALVLDEFALVFHLDDVYWTKEGRSSVDAVVISTVLGALLILHTAPLGAGDESSRRTLTLVVILNGTFVAIAALKGKLFMAAVGVFVPLVALVGSIRLAEPQSVWARRRYKPGSRRLQRSEKRYAWYAEHWRPYKEKLLDLVGGAPSEPASEADTAAAD